MVSDEERAHLPSKVASRASRRTVRALWLICAIAWCEGRVPPAHASVGPQVCRLTLVPGVRLAHVAVANFGANGNGHTDDTAAIQAALDSIPASGGAVFIPRNGPSYRVTTVRPKSGTILWGGGTIDIVDDGSRAGRSIFVDGVHDVIVFGLRIESSNAMRRSGVYGNIRINESSRISVVRCRLGRSSSVAIHTIDSSDLLFANNEVFGTFADGIHVSRGGAHVRIVDNNIHDTGDDAIGVIGYIDATRAYPAITDVSVRSNHIRNSGHGKAGNGIDVQGVTGAVIADNLVDGAQLSGIFVGATPGNTSGFSTHYMTDARIEGNDVAHVGRGLPGRGIAVHGARNVSIRRNQIRFTSSDGVLIDYAGSDIEVESNRIANAGMRGINWLQSSSTDERLVAEISASTRYGGIRVGLHGGIISANAISDVGNDGINIAGEVTLHVQTITIRDNSIRDVARSSVGIVADMADEVAILKNHISHAQVGIKVSTSKGCAVDDNASDAVATDTIWVQ